MKGFLYSLLIALAFSFFALANGGISPDAFIPFTLILSLIVYFIFFRKKSKKKSENKSLSNNYDEIKLNNRSNHTVKFRRNHGRPEFDSQVDVLSLSPKTSWTIGTYHDTWIEVYENGRWAKLHRVNHESSDSRTLQQMVGIDFH